MLQPDDIKLQIKHKILSFHRNLILIDDLMDGVDRLLDFHSPLIYITPVIYKFTHNAPI